MLDAFDELLDEEIVFLSSARLPKANSNWQRVAQLLVARALQLQRTLLDAATLGYADELTPLARALLSTVEALIFLAHGTSHKLHERKAVQYLTFGRRARRKQLKYLVKSNWLTGAEAKKIDDEATQTEDKFLALATAADYGSLRVGPDKRHWTGYDDATVFKQKKKNLRWYDHFYAPWSEDSHAQASTLTYLSDHLDRNEFPVGPGGRDPWFVLLASGEFCIEGARSDQQALPLGAQSRDRRDAQTALREAQRRPSDESIAGPSGLSGPSEGELRLADYVAQTVKAALRS